LTAGLDTVFATKKGRKMIKAILFFVFVWVTVAIGIKAFRAATNKERWSATKVVVFSLATALIAVAIVILTVVLF